MQTIKLTRRFATTVGLLRKAVRDSRGRSSFPSEIRTEGVKVVNAKAAWGQKHDSETEKERLLFRRIPIQLSLIERSIRKEKARAKTLIQKRKEPTTDITTSTASASQQLVPVGTEPTRAPSAFHSAAVLERFLLSLQYAEKQRSLFYKAKAQDMERQKEALLERMHTIESNNNGGKEAPMLQKLQNKFGTTDEDLRLLRASLIASPYLSARLWKEVAHSSVWASVVKEHRQSGDDMVLVLSDAFARVALGALADYVRGSDIHAVLPRFVVSLPSASYRRRQRQTKPPEEDSDALLNMMVQTAASQAEEGEEKASVPAPTLRWMPPHSAEVLPLAVDTLALQSFILADLDVQALLAPPHSSRSVLVLFRLLGATQKMASVTLALLADSAGSRGEAEQQRVHDVLRRTERGLLSVAAAAKAELTAGIESQRYVLTATEWAAHGADAARLLLWMDNLQLLRPRDRETRVILSHLVLALFPELRTNTRRVLEEKSRAMSLAAFMTRRHRRKLAKELRSPGEVESYLRDTTVQRARLETRRAELALRERYLSNVHSKAVVEVCEALSASEVLHLFRLLAAAVTAEEVVSPSSTAMAACLFVGEGILLTGLLETAAAEARSGVLLSSVADFYVSLALLCGPMSQLSAGGGGDRTSESQRVTFAFLLEAAMTHINGALTVRLSHLRAAKNLEHEAMKYERRRAAAAPGADAAAGMIHVRQLASVMVAVREVLEASAPTRSLARRHEIRASASGQAHQLKELLFHDREVWSEIRRLSASERQVFEEEARWCFSVSGTLDNTTTELLVRLCGPQSVSA